VFRRSRSLKKLKPEIRRKNKKNNVTYFNEEGSLEIIDRNEFLKTVNI
jgi:hypothetical protein